MAFTSWFVCVKTIATSRAWTRTPLPLLLTSVNTACPSTERHTETARNVAKPVRPSRRSCIMTKMSVAVSNIARMATTKGGATACGSCGGGGEGEGGTRVGRGELGGCCDECQVSVQPVFSPSHAPRLWPSCRGKRRASIWDYEELSALPPERHRWWPIRPYYSTAPK